MKICPQCQTSYTDDSLQFCLQDGTPLAASQTTASNDWVEAETVISRPRQDKVPVDLRNSQLPQNRANIPEMRIVEPPKKSNTALTVVLTALLTLLAVGAIVGGIYYTRGDRKTEVAQNTNSKPVNTIVPNVSKTNKTSNINSTNTITNTNTTPSATPTPKSTLNPKDVKNIESDIKNVIDDWKDSTENFNLDANLANYAERVDYYRAGTISVGAVRADKQNAFAAFSEINIDISNMRITLDNAGENATALFDKEWNFEGEGKSSAGKVQQQLQLAKLDGKWRINGEKDLKVYYTK